jgi:hypothetical protein
MAAELSLKTALLRGGMTTSTLGEWAIIASAFVS